MEIYIIGSVIAFILASVLAYIEHERNPNEEQQLGLLAVIALLSWISVLLLLWFYGKRYLRLFEKD